jgi:hypothetical protein
MLRSDVIHASALRFSASKKKTLLLSPSVHNRSDYTIRTPKIQNNAPWNLGNKEKPKKTTFRFFWKKLAVAVGAFSKEWSFLLVHAHMYIPNL